MKTELQLHLHGRVGPMALDAGVFLEAIAERWREQGTVTIPYRDEGGRIRQATLAGGTIALRDHPAGATITGEVEIEDGVAEPPAPAARADAMELLSEEMHDAFRDAPTIQE